RRLVRLDRVADPAHFGEHGRGIFALALEDADLLGERIAFRLQLLGARLEALALVLERAERGLVESEAAALQAGDDGGQVLPKELDVEHGGVILSASSHRAPAGARASRGSSPPARGRSAGTSRGAPCHRAGTFRRRRTP